MKYKVVIPSFQRASLLLRKTLTTLSKTNIDLTDLHIFVADESEAEHYSNMMHEQYAHAKIIIGKRGIAQQRNFIQDYFDEGELLFMIDDDIIAIHLRNQFNQSEPIKDLHGLIIAGFGLCNNLGKKIWGINPTTSRGNMKNEIGLGLYHAGGLFGLINSHNRSLYVDEGEWIKSRATFKGSHESHERSLKHYMVHGGILRFKNAGFHHRKDDDGGSQATTEGMEESVRAIHARYSSLTKVTYDYRFDPNITFAAGRSESFPFKMHTNVPRETINKN